MSACKDFQLAVAGVVALEHLAEADVAHAEQCPSCAALLERYRGLALLTTRTRRALEASGDLEAAAWVRIRERVDAAVESRRRRRWSWVAAFAVVGGAAAVLALVVAPRGEDGSEGMALPASALALGPVGVAPGAPRFSPMAAEPPVWAASEAGVEIVVEAGDVLEAGGAVRRIEAFGRHHLELAAGGAVRIVSWEPAKMTVEVVRGELRAAVQRAKGEDVFEVLSGDVTVRVLGTVFSVARRDDGATTVAVTRGRVGVFEGERLVREVGAGETETVDGALSTADGGEPPARRVAGEGARRRGPKIIEIDVPDQRMEARAGETSWMTSAAYRAIVSAIDSGRCRAAMKALDAWVGAPTSTSPPAAEVSKLRARCGAVP